MSPLTFVTVNGLTSHTCLEEERSAVTLVLINALGCDMRIWSAVTPQLAANYSVLRYDKRGHGLSDSPLGPYRISNFSADLHGLLGHYGRTKVVLIGLSVGGLIALDYANRYPEQVQALVLSDTLAKIGSIEYWDERISLLQQHGMGALSATILERWFSASFRQAHPAAVQGYSNLLNCMPLAGYLATCAAIGAADYRSHLATTHQPTLVLCGEEDRATPAEQVRELAEGLPNARFELIAGAGHLPPVEQPDAMTLAISRFLEENLP